MARGWSGLCDTARPASPMAGLSSSIGSCHRQPVDQRPDAHPTSRRAMSREWPSHARSRSGKRWLPLIGLRAVPALSRAHASSSFALSPPIATAGRHWIGLGRPLPSRRRCHALLAGPQAHGTRLLALQSRQIGFFGFRGRGAATYQADLVPTSFGFFKIQSLDRGLHFSLQGDKSFGHDCHTHEQAGRWHSDVRMAARLSLFD